MLQGTRFLNSLRFGRVVETRASAVETRRPLRFLDRTATVDATDDEIIGRFTGNVFAADVIMPDQAAEVYSAGKLKLVTTTIPKLKLGLGIPESWLIRLAEYEQRSPTEREADAWLAYEKRLADKALLGVRQRANALICAMRLDLVNYDRLGIKIANATFGMPSDLKATPSTAWDDTSATPITDIQAMKRYAMDTYGKVYDRVTMSNKAFDYMTATTEFKTKATIVLGAAFAAGVVNSGDRMEMQTAARRILDMTIEIEDTRITEQAADGTVSRTRVMPANKVELSSIADDGNDDVMDFANGVVVEAALARVVGNPTAAEVTDQSYGPFGYYTARPDLNPPDAVAWAVQRGWPRKHEPEATSVLTVGSFS